MSLPPVGAAVRLSGYFVPNRSIAPAAADSLGAADSPPLGADAAGALAAGLLGDWVAAPWHAANTNIALAKAPARRFRMNGPPTECVSPHCWLSGPTGLPRQPASPSDPALGRTRNRSDRTRDARSPTRR